MADLRAQPVGSLKKAILNTNRLIQPIKAPGQMHTQPVGTPKIAPKNPPGQVTTQPVGTPKVVPKAPGKEMQIPENAKNAAQRRVKRYKGRYIGPDKYKGKIPKELKSKYKGTYFGKDKYKGNAKYANAESPRFKKRVFPGNGNLEKFPTLRPGKKKTPITTPGQVHAM